MTCVLLIDDHPIVLQGCRRLLEDAGVTQVLEAQNMSEGYGLYRANQPDVIILDLTIGTNELSGLSFIQRLRRYDRHTPLLVFTMHGDPLIVSRTLKSGVNGYVLKDRPFDEFFRAFTEVRKGNFYLSPDLSPALDNEKRTLINPLSHLTPRELRILELLVEGKSYRTMAKLLSVSCTTVATTSVKIKAKLGADTLTELIKIGLQHLPKLDLSGTSITRKGCTN